MLQVPQSCDIAPVWQMIETQVIHRRTVKSVQNKLIMEYETQLQ